MELQNRARLHALDALRGACLISMIAYHGMWNLVYLFGLSADWYRGTPGHIWQQSICWTFILLSGFCWQMGRRHLKRGLMIFGGGILVSLVTHLVMPAGRITFGILTCTGSCVLLTILLDKALKKIPAGIGAAGSFALFLLLRNCSDFQLPVTRNLLTTYLGFPMPGFYSADYFPLLPWICLFACGYFLYGLRSEWKIFQKGQIPLLNWMGRHSLLVYLLHQPVLYGLCLAVDYIVK